MAFTTLRANAISYVQQGAERAKEHAKQKKSISGWVLPKQTSTFADEGSWSNIDSDVTPLDRRTWSTWTLLGFWFSDALNAQGWMGAASIIAIGLTWSAFPSRDSFVSPLPDIYPSVFSFLGLHFNRREALYCLILGYTMVIVPLILNGAIGAQLHVNFAVASRSSFGFYLSRVAVVIRMITALFWHGTL